jgi:hypothetical protein
MLWALWTTIDGSQKTAAIRTIAALCYHIWRNSAAVKKV